MTKMDYVCYFGKETRFFDTALEAVLYYRLHEGCAVSRRYTEEDGRVTFVRWL